MKNYLLGLIISFTLVLSSYAQDVKNNVCEETSSNEMKESSDVFGIEIDENTTLYSVGESESVYYIDDPKLREDLRDGDDTTPNDMASDERNQPMRRGEVECERRNSEEN